MTIDELERGLPPTQGAPGRHTDLPLRREDDLDDAGIHAWWHPLVPPRQTVPWSGMVLLALLLAHPLALVPVLDGTTEARAQAAVMMSLLLQNVGVLGAAIVLKYAWRISRNPAHGWLSAALSLAAIQNLPFGLLAVVGSPYGALGEVHGPSTIVLGVAVVVLLAMAASGRDVPGPNPLLIGFVGGGAIAGGRLVLADHGLDPTLRLAPGSAAVVLVTVGLVTMVVLVALLRLESLPAWARAGVVAATGLLTGSVTVPEGVSLLGPVTHLLVGLVGTTLLVGTAITILRAALRSHTQQLVSLSERLACAESHLRHGRERIHELSSTIAGVTSATRVLLHDGVPDGSRRARMQALLDLEIERLGRMLDERLAGAPEPVSVDDVIAPLVGVQRQLGHTVGWAPTGEVAWGYGDDLAEVVHILLVNADRHAPGSPVGIEVIRDDDRIAILVSDDGPGIEPALRRTLFDWGVRRPGSPGQGIGLQLARRLMVEQGGNLQLVSGSRDRGAAFRVTVPAAVVDGTPPQETVVSRAAEGVR